MVSGTPTRIKCLGVTPVVVTAGLIALLWIPRAVERFSKPTDGATIEWSKLLWEGQTLTVNIGDIPENAKGGLLVEGRSYLVRFRREPCVWDSLGPSGGPFYERNYPPVENHYNKAGPKVAPHLTLKQSGAQTSECNSPWDRELIVLGLILDFDRRGQLTFGGNNNHIGEIRIPWSDKSRLERTRTARYAVRGRGSTTLQCASPSENGEQPTDCRPR